MTVHADILRELLIAGYEGAALHAAFARLSAVLERHGVSAAPVVPVMVAETPVKHAGGKAAAPDRRQMSMLLASDGGMAKAGPMSAAERQANRRARLKNVTFVTHENPQVIDIIEESRNVTAERDGSAQVIEIVDDFGKRRRDVTGRRQKEKSPRPPIRKINPLSPHRDATASVSFDDPLMAVLEELAGHRFKRLAATRTFLKTDIDAARAVVAQRHADPPLGMTG